jgi:hypothetical protein
MTNTPEHAGDKRHQLSAFRDALEQFKQGLDRARALDQESDWFPAPEKYQEYCANGGTLPVNEWKVQVNRQNDRERCAAELVLVAQFIRTINRRVGDRLFALSTAISDLNTATVAPLLSPTTDPLLSGAKTRRADASQVWGDRAIVALCLDALMRVGMSEDDAATKIARQYPSIRKLAGPRATKLRITIAGWRGEFNAGRVENWHGKTVYEEGTKKLDSLTPAEYQAFAARHLEEIVDKIRRPRVV